jgi:hypothetical protein
MDYGPGNRGVLLPGGALDPGTRTVPRVRLLVRLRQREVAALPVPGQKTNLLQLPGPLLWPRTEAADS